jgi:hypothetical protein
VAKLVALLHASAALGVRIQTSLKNTKLRDISKGVANGSLARQKIHKKIFKKTAASTEKYA